MSTNSWALHCFEAIPVEEYRLPYALRAITDVTLCAFSPSELSEATFACEQHRKSFVRFVLGQLDLVHGRLADIGRRRAIGAVAHLILELYERLARLDLVQGNEMDFPIRQEDIADALGLTTEHVNRTLLKLRRLSLIQMSPPKLRVLDLGGLRREAGAVRLREVEAAQSRIVAVAKDLAERGDLLLGRGAHEDELVY